MQVYSTIHLELTYKELNLLSQAASFLEEIYAKVPTIDEDIKDDIENSFNTIWRLVNHSEIEK